jgi:hypothetical protein
LKHLLVISQRKKRKKLISEEEKEEEGKNHGISKLKLAVLQNAPKVYRETDKNTRQDQKYRSIRLQI